MFFSYKQPILLDGYDSAIVPHLLISYCCSVAKKLSVNFDCALKFDQQISSVVKTNRVVQAFITACLGYCNSYVCSDQSLLRRLQAVQNAVARLLMGKKRCDHITPIVTSLHQLQDHLRIQFKI